MNSFLLYGATGYTGELVARQAVLRGLRPVLGGRSGGKLAQLAQELGLEYRIFDLADRAAALAGLQGLTAVLNCAGPFTRTSKLLAAACIEAKVHYLDIAGEVPEFEAVESLDEAARLAGVMLMPGVGFGVVPTDGLALYLKNRLPGATRLSLAFQAVGGASRGTVETVLSGLPTGGVAREEGQLKHSPAAQKTRRVDYGEGPVISVSNPWRADLLTAYRSTSIPNIETYTAFPASLRLMMRAYRYLGKVFTATGLHNLLVKQAQKGPAGPTAEERARGKTLVWGQAEDNTGQKVAARLQLPEAYDATVLTALAVVEQVLQARFTAGFQTPAQVYGPDFVLQLPGVTRQDVAPTDAPTGSSVSTTSQVTIQASPRAVYDYATTLHNFPKHFRGYGPVPGMNREELVEGGDQLQVGLVRRVYGQDGGVLHERILRLDRPSLYAYEIISGFSFQLGLLVRHGYTEWQFEPGPGNSTRLTWRYRFDLTSPLVYPLALPIGKILMRQAMTRCLNSIKATLEQGVTAAPVSF